MLGQAAARSEYKESQFQKVSFCPISASGSNLTCQRRVNPRNTQCIPAVNPAEAESPALTFNKIEHSETGSLSQILLVIPHPNYAKQLYLPYSIIFLAVSIVQ